MAVLKGKLSIYRAAGADGKYWMHLTLEDELSHTRAVEISMDPAEFMAALSNVGDRPCHFEFSFNGLVGKKHQFKEEMVEVPLEGMYGMDKAEMASFLSPYEVDGWKGNVHDLSNMHRRVDEKGKRFQKVHFVRWVEA